MLLKERAKIGIKSALHALKIRPIYRGGNHYDDFRIHLKNQAFLTILDVGANRGQTAKELLAKYPSASIHCFGPNPDCYKLLERLGVQVHQTALGDTIGSAGFDRSHGISSMFFVTDNLSGERVAVDTVDNFAKVHGIPHIDFLKIDAEGYDLKIIRGASEMLRAREIDIVQAEVSLNSENTFQVPFSELNDAVESFGYRLFGIYEQIREWSKNAPYLRNANVVYISPRVAERNPTR
jgi:FkbM family methyltransferase